MSAKTTSKFFDRLTAGAKTPEGKVIAVFLAVCLSLMSWNVSALSYAVSNQSAVAGEEEQVDEGISGTVIEEQQVAEPEPEPEPEPVIEAEPEPEPEPVVEEYAEVADEGEQLMEEAVEPEGEEAVTEEASDEASEEEASEEEASEEDDEVEMPAQEFEATVGGVTVKVSAPKGAFPEGTSMKVVPVVAADVIDAVEAAVDGEVVDVQAIDISFVYDGEPIQPERDVTVTFGGAYLQGDEVDIFHLADGGAMETVSVAEAGSGAQSFAAASFSTYILVGVDQPDADATAEETQETDEQAEPGESDEAADGEGATEEAAEPEATSDEPAESEADNPEATEPEAEAEPEPESAEPEAETEPEPEAEPAEEAATQGAVHTVTFVVEAEDGTQDTVTQTFPVGEQATVGVLPESPFKAGSRFTGWYAQDAGGEKYQVTVDTVVESDITAYAEFTPISVYTVSVEYYYVTPTGDEVVFSTNVMDFEPRSLPREIASPENVAVGADAQDGNSVYYPEQQSVVITEDDLASAGEDGVIAKRVRYMPVTAEYDYVYYLKNLDGEGYAEIEREHHEGVMGATVTATVKNYDYANYERAEAVYIDEEAGLEVPVYYDRKSYTLTYESNGGSFVSSVTAPYGTSVSLTDETPTRTGYTFDGWYLDEGLTQKAGSSVELTGDARVFAKWKGDTVGYTIVYLFEKYDKGSGSTTFVYDRTNSTKKATVGSTVEASSAPKLTNNVSGYEYDTEWNANSKVQIAPDGSSVLYVRYKLVRYTLTFTHRASSSYNSASVTVGGTSYTNTNYTIPDVVVGQDISALWPTEVSSGRSGYLFTGWSYTTSTGSTITRVTKVTELTQELVAKANSSHVATFTASYSNSVVEKGVEYWLQQPDGTYVKDATLSQSFNSNTNSTLGAKDVEGYSQHNEDASAPSGYQDSGNTTSTQQVWVDGGTVEKSFTSNHGQTYEYDGYTWTYSHTTTSGWGWNKTTYYVYTRTEPGHYEDQTRTTYTYRFYYDRNAFNIDYFDGGTLLETKSNVLFGTNITGSDYNYVPEKPQGKEDYTWGGWCAESALETPYTFSTMPGNNLSVYAKWIAPHYTVTFDLQGGTGDFESAKTVDKNATVGFPGTPVREHYVFSGWWTEPEGGELYSWNKPVTQDATVYAHWTLAPLSYTVRYVDAETGTDLYPEKTVTSPALALDQEVRESAVTITGYRPDIAEKSVKLAFEGNEIVFNYSGISDTTSYRVQYVLASDANVHLAADKVVEGVDGSKTSVVELAAAVDKAYMQQQGYPESVCNAKYFPQDDAIEFTLGTNAEANVITFRYTDYHSAKVTVNYVDMDGVAIPGAEPVVKFAKVGSTYTLSGGAPSGYTRDHAESRLGDNKSTYQIVNGDELVINVFCQRNLEVAANNLEKSYDGTPLASRGVADLAPAVGLLPGDAVTQVAFDGSQTNAGSSATTPRDAVVTRGGTDVSYYYKVRYTAATLTVNNVNVIVTVQPDRWADGAPYDGTERTIGFRNIDAEGDTGVDISNAQYESAYGAMLRDQLRGVSLTAKDAGTYTIPAADIRALLQLPQDDNYVVTLEVRDGLLVIPQAPITVTTGSAEKAYDGTPLTEGTATVSGLAEGESVTVTAAGSQTQVGESSNGYEIAWDGANEANYIVAGEELGTLTVTPTDAEVVLTAPSATKVYDGIPLTANGQGANPVTATGLPEGFTVEATASGSQTNAGSSANVVDEGYVIRDAQGNDVTDAFSNVTTAEGTLTVEPAPLSITTGSSMKDYDGTPLTWPLATIDGLVNGEVAAVSATGEQVEVGSSPNTYAIEWGSANASNYTVSESLGTLEVVASSAEVVLTAASASKIYDGEPLVAPGVEAAGLPEGFTVEATASGTITDAGTAANVVDEGYVIRDAQGEDKTESFANITTVDGTLTVLGNPTEVVLTAASASKVYDGEPLVAGEVEAVGLPEGYTVEATASGTITDAGTAANVVDEGYVIRDAQGADKTANFSNVSTVDGTLTVVKAAAVVTITGAASTVDYDGREHEVSGYTASCEQALYDVDGSVSFTGSDTAARTDAGTTTMGLAADQFANDDPNFDVEFRIAADGFQQVNPIDVEVTITGHNATADYDGTEHEAVGYDVQSSSSLFGEDDFTFSGTARAARTDAGTTAMGLSANQFAKSENANFNTVTFTVADGSVTVNPVNANVTVTGHSVTADYDGEAHAASGYDMQIEGGLLTEDDIVFTGEAQAERTDAGTTVMGLSANQFAVSNPNFANVTFTVADGSVTVNPINVTVSIVGASNTTAYDGNEHAVSGYEATADSELYDVEADFAFRGSASASQREVGTSTMGLAANQFANMNPNFGNVTFVVVDGFQEVTPAVVEVTITGNSVEANYDGAPHAVSGYRFEASDPLYHEDYLAFSGTAEASRTDAGTTPMGLAANQFANGNDNFDVTFTVVDGFATVNPIDVDVTITGHASTLRYDGQSHEVAGFDMQASSSLFTEDDLVFTPAEDATLADGEIAASRTDAGTTPMGLAAEQFAAAGNSNFANVTFTVIDGYQTIEPIDVTVSIAGAVESVLYDGGEHVASGYAATASTELFDVDADIVFTGEAQAARTDAGTTPMELDASQFSCENPNFANVEFQVTDGSVTVLKRAVKLVSATDSKEYDGTPLVRNGQDDVSVEGDGFADGEGATFDIVGTQTTVGTSPNSFDYELTEGTDEGNYDITVELGTLTVTNRDAAYEIEVVASSATETYDGTQKSASGFETLEFTENGQAYTVSGLDASAAGTDVGTYASTISGVAVVTDAQGNDVTDQFAVSVRPGTLTIEPRAITVKAADAAKEYDGSALVDSGYEIVEGSFVDGEGFASVTVEGSQTAVGESENVIAGHVFDENTKAGNYAVTYAPGTLTVNRSTVPISVVSADGAWTYDGLEHAQVRYTVSFGDTVIAGEGGQTAFSLPTGDILTVSGAPSVVHVADSGTANSFEYELANADLYGDVSTSFGTLAVGKRNVTLSSASASKEYDGTALTDDEVSVLGDGFAEGEGYVVEVTGSQTLVGSSSNTFSYGLDLSTTQANDYAITCVFGTLEVTDREQKFAIDVVANSESFTYDGTQKSASGFQTLEFVVAGQPFTVAGLSASASAVDAGEYANAATGTAQVLDAQGNDVTAQFDVQIHDGTLSIGKRDVLIASADLNKEYDGTALRNDGAPLVVETGWAPGEGADYVFTGSQLNVGTSANSFSYTLRNAKEDNYTIRKTEGALTVADRTERFPIDVVANSATYTYDGTQKSVSGFQTLEFVIGGVTFTVSGISAEVAQTNAGVYANQVEGIPQVTDPAGNVVTGQFDITCANGELAIGKRQVMLTSASATKPYDGNALASDSVTVGGEGFAEGEGASYTVLGSQTVPGVSANLFDYTLDENTLAGNYDIVKENGTLTVTNRTARYAIEVRAQGGHYTYDATERVAEGLTQTTFVVEGNTYEVSGLNARVAATDAGSYVNSVVGTAVVTDAQGNDVTSQFAVTAKPGLLQIDRRPVSFAGESGQSTYDGREVELSGVEADGLVEGHTADVAYTVRGTVPGSYTGTITDSANVAIADAQGNDVTANYAITTEPGTLQILDREQKYDVSVTALSGAGVYNGTSQVVAGFANQTERGIRIEADGLTYYVTGLHAAGSGTDAGSYPVAVTGTAHVIDAAGNDVTSQFDVNAVPGTLSISKRPVTLTSASAEREYDGMPLTRNAQADVMVSGSGFAPGEGATYAITGSQLLVGASDNEFTYELNGATKAENYDIDVAFGKLVVTDRTNPYQVTVVANSASGTYDGTLQAARGFEELSFTVAGNVYTVSGLTTSDPERADAGTYVNAVGGEAVVLDAAGNDVTAQFRVNAVNGTLQIAPRQVMLTSATDSKQYDGRPLVRNASTDVVVTGDGFVSGEGAIYAITGSQTIVGSSQNTFSFELAEGTKASNYNIQTAFGTLTVTNRDALYAITVEANSSEAAYDGTPKSATGFRTLEFDVDGNLYTVSGLVTSDPVATDAGVYPNNITGTPVVRDAEGNDVTGQFAVQTADGQLSIGKIAASFTGQSATREYTGSEIEITGVGSSGLLEGHAGILSYSAKGTVPGEYTGQITAAQGVRILDAAGRDVTANYDVATQPGKLVVTDREEPYAITVVANSDEQVYDGAAKTVFGLQTSEFVVAGNAYTVEGLSASATGTDAGAYASEVQGTPVVRDAQGNDVTKQFAVSTEDGELRIGKRPVELVSASAEKVYDGVALTTLDDPEQGITVGDMGFAPGEGAAFAVSGSQLVPGTSPNVFTYTLNPGVKASNYDIEQVFGTLAVNDRDVKFVIDVKANSESATYDGTPKVASGFADEAYIVNGQTYTVHGLSATVSAADAGTYVNAVNGAPVVLDAFGNDVTSQFSITRVNGELSIAPRQVTLASATAGKEYDGDALVDSFITVSGDGWAEGEGASYDVTGSQTLVGSSANTFTYALNPGTKAGNYQIAQAEGTLTVTNRSALYAIEVQANSERVTYDGQAHEAAGVQTLEFTVGGNNYTVSGLVTEDPTQTDAGTYTNNIIGTPVVTDAAGNDVSSQFAVSTRNGSLVIDPRPVTLTSASDSKEYDGNALVAGEVSVSGEGWAEGEGATYAVAGSQLLPGSSPNAFEYVPNANTNLANYDVTKVEGTLSVSDRAEKYRIEVVANSATQKYSGTEQVVEGLQGTSAVVDGNSYTVEGLAARAAGTDVGTYASLVTGEPVVRDAAGNDVTNQFAIDTIEGELQIQKRDVTLTSASDSKEYDGMPLTNDQVTVSGDGFVGAEGAEYAFAGSQTLVGASSNSFTFTLVNGAKWDNYHIVTNEGTLEVIDRAQPFAITVEGNSASFLYDGAEHSAVGVKTLDFTVNDLPYTVEGLVAQGVGTNAGTYINHIEGTPVVRDAAGNDVTAQFAVVTADGELQIAKRSVKLTSATDSKQYDGSPLVNTTVSISGDGFAPGEGATCDVTGSQRVVGSSANTFSYVLDEGTDAANYDIAVAEGTLTVTNRDALYEIVVQANSESADYDGNVHEANGFKTLQFEVAGNTYTVAGLSTENPAQVNVGTYTNNITGTPVVFDAQGNDVSSQFAVETRNGKLVVNRIDATFTGSSRTFEYTGDEFELSSVAAEGLLQGHEGVLAYSAKGTIPGIYPGSITPAEGVRIVDAAGNDVTANYNVATHPGMLTVAGRTAPYEIAVQPNSATYLYDGTAKSATGFADESYTVNGHVYTVEGITALASGTDAGTYESQIDGAATVRDAAGNDVTGQFTVKGNKGSLVIQKRDVTLTSASDGKEYDGTVLTNSTVSVGGDGFAAGEGATYDVTGSQLLVGSSENAFAYELVTGTNAANYNITTGFGTLTVSPRQVPFAIEVASNGATHLYDGTTKSVEGFPTLEFEVGGQTYTIEGLTSEVEGTDAGTYVNAIEGSAIVRDAAGNDVTSQFNVSFAPGELVIAKRSVTLTSATDSREYNGTALTNDEVSVGGDGFVQGEGATYDVTGSQLLVGTSANTFSYALNAGTKASNYDIRTTEGTLTVTNRDARYAITVQAASAEAVYDGQPHTASGFETLAFTVDGNEYTVYGLSTSNPEQVNVGSYANNVTGTAIVRDAAGNNVTSQFAVDVAPGTLSITPRDATFTGESGEFEYTGYDVALRGVTADGLVPGHVGNAVYLAEGTVPGAYEGSITDAADVRIADSRGSDVTANYRIATAPGTLTITDRAQRPVVEVVANSGTFVYNGQEHAVSGFVAESERGIRIVDDNGLVYYVTGLTAAATGTDAGDYMVEISGDEVVLDTAGRDVTSQFSVAKTRGSLVIERAPMSVAAASYSGMYDGANHQGGATVSVLEGNEVEVVYTWIDENGVEQTSKVAPSIRDAGTIEYAVSATSPNYNPAVGSAVLEVGKRTISFASAGGEKVYDGTPLVRDGEGAITVGGNGFAPGEGATYQFSGVQVDAGKSLNAFGYTLNEGTNAENYLVGPLEFGELSVTPAPLTVTTGSAAKAYDGTPLTSDQITVEGLVNGETAPFATTGARTQVGASPNTYDRIWTGSAKPDNYTITDNLGTLSVSDGTDDEPAVGVASKTHPMGVYPLGSTVTFDISVTNPYEDARDITLAELSGVDLAQTLFLGVAPGATVHTTATYTVTESDVAAGVYDNTITASFSDGKSFTATDRVYADEPDSVLEVSKSVLNPKDEYAIGDSIDFAITVMNDRAAEVTNVIVEDTLRDAPGTLSVVDAAGGTVEGSTVTFDALAAGEQRTIVVRYVTTEADAGTRITNAVVASAGSLPDVPPATSEVTTNPVEPLYTLTVDYFYEAGDTAAPSTVEKLAAGDGYDVTFPVIDGYTSTIGGTAYQAIAGAMPTGEDAQDITVTVVYVSPDEGVVPGRPVAPATPSAPIPGAPEGYVPDATGTADASGTTDASADTAGATADVPASVATVEIGNDGVPTVQDLDDDANALAQGATAGNWSLFDLFATLLAALLAVVMAVRGIGRKRKEDEAASDEDQQAQAVEAEATAQMQPGSASLRYGETSLAGDGSQSGQSEGEEEPATIVKRRRALRVAGVVVGVASVLLLLVTQDFTQDMTIFDQWSVLFAIMAIANAVLTLLSRRRKTDEDEDEDGEGSEGPAVTPTAIPATGTVG